MLDCICYVHELLHLIGIFCNLHYLIQKSVNFLKEDECYGNRELNNVLLLVTAREEIEKKAEKGAN